MVKYATDSAEMVGVRLPSKKPRKQVYHELVVRRSTVSTKQADRTKNTANLHYGKPRVVDYFEEVGEIVFSS